MTPKHNTEIVESAQNSSPASWLSALRAASVEEIPRAAIHPATPDRAPCSADELGLPEVMGGQTPAVSVVIPTYTDAGYLPDALESVGAQTMSDLEVVIVDSSEEEWVAELAAQRSWIQYVPTQPDGVSAARNTGIGRATGQWVAFLDADDYWHPAKLARQLDVLDGDCAASFTGHFFVNYWNSGKPSVEAVDVARTDSENLARAVLRRELTAHISTMVCKRSRLPGEAFEELRNFEDVLFAIERLHDGSSVHVPTPLAVRRLRPDSLADRTDELVKAADRIEAYRRLASRYPEYTDDARGQIATEQYRMGVISQRNGQSAKARRYFRRAYSDHPSPLKVAFRYLSTLPPARIGRWFDDFAGAVGSG